MDRRLLIFDVEGTLIDNARTIVLSWHQILSEHGFAFSVKELEGLSGLTPNEMTRALAHPEASRLASELKPF